MKYLLFNIAVLSALVYLLGNATVLREEKPSLSPMVQQVVPQATGEKTLSKKHVTEEVSVPEKPLPQQVAEPVKVVEPVREKPAAPPALPAAQEVQKVAAVAVTQSPKGPVPVAVAEPKPAPVEVAQVTQSLQSAPVVSKAETHKPNPDEVKARAQDLRNLVADMERMFAEKMAR